MSKQSNRFYILIVTVIFSLLLSACDESEYVEKNKFDDLTKKNTILKQKLSEASIKEKLELIAEVKAQKELNTQKEKHLQEVKRMMENAVNMARQEGYNKGVADLVTSIEVRGTPYIMDDGYIWDTYGYSFEVYIKGKPFVHQRVETNKQESPAITALSSVVDAANLVSSLK